MAEDKITGPYVELAQLLQELFGDRSSRHIGRVTGVNFSTISTLRKGDRAAAASLVKIARAYDRNPNELLLLAGYDPQPEYDLAREREAPPTGDDLSYTTDPELLELVEYYRGLPPAMRQGIRQTVKSAAEMAREMDAREAIGRRADIDDNPAEPPGGE